MERRGALFGRSGFLAAGRNHSRCIFDGQKPAAHKRFLKSTANLGDDYSTGLFSLETEVVNVSADTPVTLEAVLYDGDTVVEEFSTETTQGEAVFHSEYANVREVVRRSIPNLYQLVIRLKDK